MKKLGVILLAGMITAGLAGCGPKRVAVPASTEVHPDVQVIDHTILSGETLDLIADNYYGDPSRAEDIARDNGLADPYHIAEGSVLALRFAPDQWQDAQKRATALVPYNRGVDLLERDRLADAARQFQLALDTAPDLAAARYNLALVHLRRGMNTAGLDLLAALTEDRPSNTDFRFARGHALFQLTRFDEAVEQFQRVLELDPSHTRAAFSLARSLQASERLAEARRAWQDYLNLDSTSSWADTARRNLGQVGNGGS